MVALPFNSYFVCGGVVLPGLEFKTLRRDIGLLGFNLKLVSSGVDLGNRKVISLFRLVCKENKKDLFFFLKLKNLLLASGFYFLSYVENKQFYLASTFEKVSVFWNFCFFIFFFTNVSV